MEREELMKICEDAVVHHTKWRNRDSYVAQLSVQSAYRGLKAGLEFRVVTPEMNPAYHSDEGTLIVEFLQPIDFTKLEVVNEDSLKISSRQDYFRDCDPKLESEMFDGEGIDFYSRWTKTYVPSRTRLEAVGKGNDWY